MLVQSFSTYKKKNPESLFRATGSRSRLLDRRGFRSIATLDDMSFAGGYTDFPMKNGKYDWGKAAKNYTQSLDLSHVVYWNWVSIDSYNMLEIWGK